MKNSTLTILKILASIPIGFGLIYPFLYDSNAAGLFGELRMFGTVGAIIAALVFLLLVLFYALDLIKCLRLVAPESRRAAPNSVWWMFLLPYNFIEDFFIIFNVSKSLEAEAKLRPELARFKSFGMISGLGWCAAQVVSLIPNEIGAGAGLLAILLWIWHWVFIRRANQVLQLPCA